VYLTAGENFRREHGRDYLGSRDIDLGFHIEKDWSRDELKNSGLAIAVTTLIEMGFEPMSFRLVKHFHIDTGQELRGEDAKKTPSYDIFDLFIDPVVDHIHPEAQQRSTSSQCDDAEGKGTPHPYDQARQLDAKSKVSCQEPTFHCISCRAEHTQDRAKHGNLEPPLRAI
jgi:hypothetical protein